MVFENDMVAWWIVVNLEKSEEENEFLTYAKRLGNPRRQLLKAFLAIDRSVVNTADLREETEADEEETSVSEGSILHL